MKYGNTNALMKNPETNILEKKFKQIYFRLNATSHGQRIDYISFAHLDLGLYLNMVSINFAPIESLITKALRENARAVAKDKKDCVIMLIDFWLPELDDEIGVSKILGELSVSYSDILNDTDSSKVLCHFLRNSVIETVIAHIGKEAILKAIRTGIHREAN